MPARMVRTGGLGPQVEGGLMPEDCNLTGVQSPLLKIRQERWNSARPMSAQIEITYVCNLDCTFCYNVVDRNQREMSTLRSV